MTRWKSARYFHRPPEREERDSMSVEDNLLNQHHRLPFCLEELQSSTVLTTSVIVKRYLSLCSKLKLQSADVVAYVGCSGSGSLR